MVMGYFSCNGKSAIAVCDPYNWDLTNKPRKIRNKTFKIREFSYSDLHSATNGFSRDKFLGKGSHGSVYKAQLDDGKLIAAVKRTTSAPSNQNCRNCTNTPAENEIEILSRVRNPRLVNLLGFAVDSTERKLIVVEFMPNGSLYDLLHGSGKPPGWSRRVRFALQIARAVQHLHLSSTPVIHRDIKSSNVLIDAKWDARLGDFGLALRGHVEDVRAKCTPPAGTLGYLDPGYLAPGDLSTKSDVFSFGILLLEIISGRNAIDVNYSPPSVVDWAVPMIKVGDFSGICDTRISRPNDEAAMRQLAVIAARCVTPKPEKRPAMTEVVECLKAAMKRLNSPIWNNIGWRVGGARETKRLVKYESLDESTEAIKTTRSGSRRNRKISCVESGIDISDGPTDRVGRSKSIGSVREIKFGPFDSINSINSNNRSGIARRRVGLAVRMTTVRLNKSRSMSVLQGTRLVSNHGVVLEEVVKNPNCREKEESKLLINLEKGQQNGDTVRR